MAFMSQPASIGEKAIGFPWKKSERGHHWQGGRLAGCVSRAGDPDAAGLDIHFDVGPAQSLRLQLGNAIYQPTGGQPTRTMPSPTEYFVQQPYLVAKHGVASSVGLHLKASLLAEANSLILDVEMETIDPLDNVELGGRLAFTGIATPSDAHHRVEKAELRWQNLMRGNELVGALLFDTGESGFAEVTPTGLDLTWFRQPLEKGVILVGRFAVVRRGDEAPEEFQEMYADWLERPTFL